MTANVKRTSSKYFIEAQKTFAQINKVQVPGGVSKLQFKPEPSIADHVDPG